MNKDDILIVSALEVETQGQLEDYDTLYTGVGKVNATFKLTKRLSGDFPLQGVVSEFAPKLVINYGTAGSRKIKKKQLVDCTKFIQRDMDVTGLGFMRGETPFEPNVPIILDFDHMEAYALAKVCWTYNIDFISFKYITDGADEQAHEDWEANLADGIKEFKEKILNGVDDD